MNHKAPLANWLVVVDPQEKHNYMAASNLMSLHMLSQQGKGMAALLIPLYRPYISAGCQSRGLHPERLRKQKQLVEKTDRRACLCLPTLKKCFPQAENNCPVIKRSNAAFSCSSHEYLSTSPYMFLHERPNLALNSALLSVL